MGCQIDAGEDLEGIEEFEAHDVKARKPHKCGECGNRIKPGERYERATGFFEGRPWTFKTCAICIEIRSKLFCSWGYSTIWEELAEHSVFTLSLAGLSEAAIDRLTEFWKR